MSKKVSDNKRYESLLLQDFGNRTGASIHVSPEANNFIYTNNLNDPTSLGFKLFFRFDTTHGLLASEQYQNSAIAYLKRIGQEDRAELLIRFIEHLQNISSIDPWLFQTISGLTEIKNHEPWKRRVDDSKITIGTLETVELSIQTLISMLRAIVWDETRSVWVLPVNLRQFDLSLYIYPKISYQVDVNDENAIGTVPNARRSQSGSIEEVGDKNVMEHYYIKSPDLYNHICWDLSECEFNFWESGESFLSLDNVGNEVAANDIVITYKYVKSSYRFYRILGDTVYSDYALALRASTLLTGIEQENFWKKMGKDFLSKSLQPVTSRASNVLNAMGNITQIDGKTKYNFDLDKLKSTGMTILGGLAETAFDRISREVSGRLQSMFLGNVYGISHDSFLNTLTSQSASEFIFNAGRSKASLQSAPSMNSEYKLKPNENVYSKL